MILTFFQQISLYSTIWLFPMQQMIITDQLIIMFYDSHCFLLLKALWHEVKETHSFVMLHCKISYLRLVLCWRRDKYKAFCVRENVKTTECEIIFTVGQLVSTHRGAAKGDPEVPACSLSKQPTTGGENDMTNWWVPSIWHSVRTPSLENPGYAPDTISFFFVSSLLNMHDLTNTSLQGFPKQG